MSKPLSYKANGNWGVCQRCQVTVRAQSLRKEWTGLLVCHECWEPRHPQDFIRGRKENVVPAIVSPEPPERYLDVTFAATTTTIPTGTFDGALETIEGVYEEYRVTATGDSRVTSGGSVRVVLGEEIT